LDTREKIVPVEQLAGHLAKGQWLAAAGTFDPLTLSHAEWLAALSEKGKSVLGVVESGEGCLLPVEARAVLVAALKSVQLVVVVPQVDALPRMLNLEIVNDEVGERKRSLAFVEHVRGRQAGR